MQPSNVSGMDGRASAISKHVPQGNILLLGQTRYYAPEETSCLFQWADPLTPVTYSLSPVARSPHHPHAQFLSLYSYFISSMVLCFKYVLVSQFHLHSAVVFRSLPRTLHASTL